MKYNFKDIYQSFNISYFTSNDSNLLVDVNELKNYELLEDNKNNITSVLIKRFKLRVSFLKSFKFSDEIIISDDVNFDCNSLSHEQNLIKIAIINDSVNEWINSPNFNNYDYFFTNNEEHWNLLKDKNMNSFIIEGNCVYTMTKNILNVLYKRKSEKFQDIVSLFSKVFPQQHNYFRVLNSEYFDGEWYKATYNISENNDSVIHFLLLGFDKGYDPGPDFSIKEYYECNRDVEVSGMNPLIHYEKYGRNENRIIHVSEIGERDYNAILNSSYFDREWYVATYDIPADVDPAEHYLKTGFVEDYNPGPNFNSHEYYQRNVDIKAIRMNPLLHYELYGKNENRPLFFTDEQNERFYSTVSNSSYFDGEWYADTYGIDADVDPVDHYLKIGYAKRWNPSTQFDTSSYYKANPDVKMSGMNPLLHYELYGRKENRPMFFTDDQINKWYDALLNSHYFDRQWYVDNYDIPDDVDPVEHYMNEGFKKGFDPSPKFSNEDYYECNPDVKQNGMNPLLHYELHGRRLKRKIHL